MAENGMSQYAVVIIINVLAIVASDYSTMTTTHLGSERILRDSLLV